MRKYIYYFIITLLSCIPGIYASVLYIQSLDGNPEFIEIIDNNIKTYQPILGETYCATNSLSIITTNSYHLTYVFPNDIIMMQNNDTQMFISTFDIKYNIPTNKVQQIYTYSSDLIVSLDGGLYIGSNTTNQTIVYTPAIITMINNGGIYINSNKLTTHLYVLDGKATVIDNNSTNMVILNENTHLIANNTNKIYGKGKSISDNFVVSQINTNEYSNMYTIMDSLMTNLNNVFFISVDTNIYGVYLKK